MTHFNLLKSRPRTILIEDFNNDTENSRTCIFSYHKFWLLSVRGIDAYQLLGR